MIICNRCKNEVSQFIKLRKVINNGKRSWAYTVPMCIDCMNQLNFLYDEKDVIKE